MLSLSFKFESRQTPFKNITNKVNDSNTFKLIAQFATQAKDIQTDKLGNLYVLTVSNQLYKYDAYGKLLSTLNFAYIGNITHLDASNPFEIYLFYRELTAVVFLDTNLAYRGRMNLEDAAIIQKAIEKKIHRKILFPILLAVQWCTCSILFSVFFFKEWMRGEFISRRTECRITVHNMCVTHNFERE